MVLICAQPLSSDRGMIALRIRVTRRNGCEFTITWRREFTRLLDPNMRAEAQWLRTHAAA
ncbi:hypothetical protein KGQ24_01165 [Patescibacteria group bacterium]|nr:hypothetical protein [Patescibacteria group bacterium]